MKEPMLKNKVVLITGATSGIGEAAARMFAREGARVVLSGRRAKLGETIADQIRATGGIASYIRADVSRESEVNMLIMSIVEKYGRLDAAFNNARADARFSTLIDSPTSDFDTAVAVNLRGTWLSMRAEARAMLATGGSIVNTSSWLTTNGTARSSIDSSIKGGIDAMTRAAALELAELGIRVNAIQRYGTPEEIAATALWLVSDASASVTGRVIGVDGRREELRAS